MKKLFIIFMIVSLCAATIFAQETEGSQTEKNGIIGRIIDDMTESTRNVHEINKENMAAVRAESKANFTAATTPNPTFVDFIQTKGFVNKVKFLAANIKESGKQVAANEGVRRSEILSHGSYRTTLEGQRTGQRVTTTY